MADEITLSRTPNPTPPAYVPVAPDAADTVLATMKTNYAALTAGGSIAAAQAAV